MVEAYPRRFASEVGVPKVFTAPYASSLEEGEHVIAEHPDVADADEVRLRYDELRAAGYSWGVALTLAGTPEVDLELARRLLARGCPVTTAVRILMP